MRKVERGGYLHKRTVAAWCRMVQAGAARCAKMQLCNRCHRKWNTPDLILERALPGPAEARVVSDRA